MLRRLLITGGAGFIGANFVHHWLAGHPEDTVVVLDALTYAGNIANLNFVKYKNTFTFVHGNICDIDLIDSVMRQYEIDTIVHFAAESHVDRSIDGPDAFIETNILGTYSLLKAAKNHWLQGESALPHHFHHVSTDEVYGTLEKNDPAFTEDTAFAPNSPYSASKAASDHLVRAWHHTYGLNVTTSNCSNNYGPFHFPEKLIPLVITNILYNKPLPIYGDGRQVRDWLFVEDHARGIELVLNRGVAGETYNIGGHNEWANIEIVEAICSLINAQFRDNKKWEQKYPEAKAAIKENSESLITFVDDRPGHDRRYAIDATKSRDALGYTPVESFESGIRKTVEWYLENDTWWKSVINRTYR